MTVAIWLAGTPANACGGLVHSGDEFAHTDAAEVILERGDDGTAHVSYAVRWEGDATDFGWVVPVAGTFVGLEDADPARFEELRRDSMPEVEYPATTSSGGGCACGGGAKAGDARSLSGGSQGSVDVVASGFTGTYEYVAVTADEPEALDAWFADHGWDALDPGDLGHYVDAGATFVALRVRPDAAPEIAGLLPPVTFRYDGPLSYPAALLRHAMSDQRTTLYVLGDGLAELDGWAAAEVPRIVGEEDEDPVALFEGELRLRGADRGYLRTWAGDVGDGFLTRFDTLAPIDVHTVDVAIATDGAPREVRTVIDLSGGSTTYSSSVPTSGAALLLSPLAGLVAARRRRRG